MSLPSLLLPGCEKTPANPNLGYVPPNSSPYTTNPGDDWWKLADRPDVNMNALGLCTFNFQTSSAPEINWYLRNKAGCKQATSDRKNYKFSGGERIFLPVSAGTVTPPAHNLPPTPLNRQTIQACILVVKSDQIALSRINSILSVLPGGVGGGVRNFALVLGLIFSFGNKFYEPSQPGSYASRMICTGIAEAAFEALARNKSRIPQLIKADAVTRFVPFDHDAVLITVEAPGHAPTNYVLDWWRSLDADHPWFSRQEDFLKGQNGQKF